MIVMITFLSIVLLSSASGAILVDSDTTRLAYSNCLVEFTTTHLDEKTGTSEFRKAAVDACPSERSAMIAAMKKDEMEFGSSESEAAKYAREEADGVLFSFTDGYAGFASSNTRPVKEE